MKRLEFIGTSQEDLKNFPAEARRDAGFQLHFVQMGQEPSDWQPMKTVGAGAVEVRMHREGEWRIIYVAKFQSSVCVLHAFEKKSQKTRQSDIDIVRERYKEVEQHEKAKQKDSR